MKQQSSGPVAAQVIDISAGRPSGQHMMAISPPQIVLQKQTNQTTARYKGYRNKSIAVGCIHLLLDAIILGYLFIIGGYSASFPVISVPSIVFITGVTGMATSCNPNKCKVLTMSVISAVCCIIMIIAISLWITEKMQSVIIIFAITELIVGMSHCFFCCSTLYWGKILSQIPPTGHGLANGGFVSSSGDPQGYMYAQGGLPSQSIPMTTNGTTIPIHIDGAAHETGIGSEEMCYQDIATYDSFAVTTDDSLPSYKRAMATNTPMATNVSLATNAYMATSASSATNASMATTQTDGQPTDADLTYGEHVYQGLYSEIDMSKL